MQMLKTILLVILIVFLTLFLILMCDDNVDIEEESIGHQHSVTSKSDF